MENNMSIKQQVIQNTRTPEGMYTMEIMSFTVVEYLDKKELDTDTYKNGNASVTKTRKVSGEIKVSLDLPKKSLAILTGRLNTGKIIKVCSSCTSGVSKTGEVFPSYRAKLLTQLYMDLNLASDIEDDDDILEQETLRWNNLLKGKVTIVYCVHNLVQDTNKLYENYYIDSELESVQAMLKLVALAKK